MKEIKWGRTIGTHGARGGSNGMQYERHAELAMTATTYGRTYIRTIQTKLDIEGTSVWITHARPIMHINFVLPVLRTPPNSGQNCWLKWYLP